MLKYNNDPDFIDHMVTLRKQMFEVYAKLGLFPDMSEEQPVAGGIEQDGEDPFAEAPELADTPKLPTDAPRFIAAEKFEGSKPGYYFTKGKQGLGYYVDE